MIQQGPCEFCRMSSKDLSETLVGLVAPGYSTNSIAFEIQSRTFYGQFDEISVTHDYTVVRRASCKEEIKRPGIRGMRHEDGTTGETSA